MTNKRPFLPASTACPAIAVLPLSTYSPGPCWPLQPCAASSFLPPRPPSGCLHFDDLNIANSPVNPCGLYFRVYVLPLPFPKPLTPLPASTYGPGPFQSLGVSYLQSWPPVLLRLASSSPATVPPRLWMSSGSCNLLLGALLRVYTRPECLHSLGINRPCPHPRATWS